MTDEPSTIADSLPVALQERINAIHEKAAAMGAPIVTAADLARVETETEAQERLEARQAVYQARWHAQVPPMYAEASWDDLDPEQQFVWPEDSLNLVLAGAVGTGKTHAAYALGHAASRRGWWVQAVTTVDLLAAMRPDGDASLSKAAAQCRLLILDDLAAGKASDWAKEQMTDLLDLRIREGRRTVVTTNSQEVELEAAWGGRFLDRLRYRRTVHVFRGESRRKGAW